MPITTFCNAVRSVFATLDDTVNMARNGVHMANTHVENALINQQINSEAELEFIVAKRGEKIAKKLEANPNLKKSFDQARKDIKEARAKLRNR